VWLVFFPGGPGRLPGVGPTSGSSLLIVWRIISMLCCAISVFWCGYNVSVDVVILYLFIVGFECLTLR